MDSFIEKELCKIKEQGRYREFKPLADRHSSKVTFEGKQLLNLSSNDYLGIGGDRELHRTFYDELDTVSLTEGYGLGSCSSRLLTGDHGVNHRLETLLASSYGKQSSLLFNSGYHANIGILPALTTKNDLIISDKLNHASLVDGMRLSRADSKRYRHTDYDHLNALLAKHRQEYKNVTIVSESVFSMDGDVADVQILAELKNRYDCQLYLDEAHSVGLYGANGLGIAEQQGVLKEVDILVGTFGKAFGSMGAYLLCTSIMKDFLINRSRSLIFTTALPPIISRWNLFVFSRLGSFSDKRSKLAKHSSTLRKTLSAAGLETAGTTNIVPVMIGDDTLTTELAQSMQEYGYLVLPVRPPTVPEGTSRFRLSLTADMNWDDLKHVAGTIASLHQKPTRK